MALQLIVQPCEGPLRGSVPAPSDAMALSVALGVAALCDGKSRLKCRGVPEAARALAGALRTLGVEVTEEPEALVVVAKGLAALTKPSDALDARGMPIAAFVLAGLVAGEPFESTLLADDFVADEIVAVFEGGRSVAQSDAPGGGRAVHFDATAEDERFAGARVHLAGARPGAKVAALLAGLRAGSTTVVHESIASPDHCERLLSRLRMPVRSSATTLELHPPRDANALTAFEFPELGDFSASAYLLAASVLVPESHVTLRGVGLNPTRVALLDGLRSLGARTGTSPQGDALGEPIGELTAFGSDIAGGVVGGEVGVRLGDDFVPAALVGARARGTVEISDVLSGGGVWASAAGVGRDVARLVGILRAFGVEASPTSAGLVIQGTAGRRLAASRVTTGGDHRLALAATVLALAGDGPSVIDDVECISRFFPRFVGSLRALGARIEVRTE